MHNQADLSLIRESIELAEKWQFRASELVSDFDRKFFVKMNKMLKHPEDKALLVELMDQCFRSKSPERVANQIVFLLKKHGMASFFTASDKLLLTFFRHLGVLAPKLSVPLFVKQIREDSRTVVLKGEKENFDRHLQRRKQEGVRNIANLIGEVVLGEEEAEARMQKYLNALENPNIDYLSIKLSTLYSQMNSLDMEGIVGVLVERLSRLFDQAIKHGVGENGISKAKFINLDMEEYRDLEITVRVFKETLSKPEYRGVYAGIALQAYLPDSIHWQRELTDWAVRRVGDGGSPIKVRLVKGANMEMEMTEADLKGWGLVTFDQKTDTDANYKRMASYALQPEHARAVHLGVASHNLFELAHAVTLAKREGSFEFLTLEMLEGMSESARMAIHELTMPVMLYAPSAAREQFTNAIAYLVRRLDENTGDENFIRYSFGLKVGTKDWEYQKQLFVDSFDREPSINNSPNRQQNRYERIEESSGKRTLDSGFRSEADSDFTLPKNREWAKKIRDDWMFAPGSEPISVPVVVAGEDIRDQRTVKAVSDRSQLPRDVVFAHCCIANEQDLAKAVACAKEDPDGWRSLSVCDQSHLLRKTAQLVRDRRDRLIGVAAAELGKVITETDVEVSEAIDFLEFYAHSREYFEGFDNLKCEGRGVGLVVPPWNFPIAIPLGGVAAALAAGNTVILKPASIAMTCAYELCKCFWDAGISKSTLQLLPCPGSMAGEHLVKHPDVDFVILTGGEDTAHKMLDTRPDLFLTAETGGKDATIVTAMSDREQAIRNVCQSAFSNSGQKCSATSLLVLEREVYEDESFRNALVDAAKSMSVGSPWEFKNRISLLANPVSGALEKALNSLEEGEFWALAPEYAEGNSFMLKPCIKWGVAEGSFCHMTELFGPVLSVMCAENLEHAIDIVNGTGYGLTSGIESLDEREIEIWKARIHAGNLYINRGTTGAIVLRQPFGGLGKSAMGAGRKVGIYNYIAQFMNIAEVGDPVGISENMESHFLFEAIHDLQALEGIQLQDSEIAALKNSVLSNAKQLTEEFLETKDYFGIRGEDNLFRYLPVKKVVLRVLKEDSMLDMCLRLFASDMCNVPIDVSCEESGVLMRAVELLSEKLTQIGTIVCESDSEFAERIGYYSRVLYSDWKKVPDVVYLSASKTATFVVRQKPMKEGRLELLNYFEEQSISHSYHRYGNLGERGMIQKKMT